MKHEHYNSFNHLCIQLVVNEHFEVLQSSGQLFPYDNHYIIFKSGDRLQERLSELWDPELENTLSNVRYTFQPVSVELDRIWREEPLKLLLVADSEEFSQLTLTFYGLKIPVQVGLQHKLYNQMLSLQSVAAPIANKMNNPMGAMLNQIGGLLAKDWNNMEQHDLLSELTTMQEQIYNMSAITNALATFSQKHIENFHRVNVNRILQSSIDLTRLAKSEYDIEFNVQLTEDVPDIQGDEMSLEQSFVNILLNAEEAMTEGGLITISDGLYNRDSNYIEILISDKGKGIPPNDVRKVFDPFYTTKNSEHSGLGLCVAYGIISQHQGYIEISSYPQRGTQVSVLLPRIK